MGPIASSDTWTENKVGKGHAWAVRERFSSLLLRDQAWGTGMCGRK